jgi:hypothetical protein
LFVFFIFCAWWARWWSARAAGPVAPSARVRPGGDPRRRQSGNKPIAKVFMYQEITENGRAKSREKRPGGWGGVLDAPARRPSVRTGASRTSHSHPPRAQRPRPSRRAVPSNESGPSLVRCRSLSSTGPASGNEPIPETAKSKGFVSSWFFVFARRRRARRGRSGLGRDPGPGGPVSRGGPGGGADLGTKPLRKS